MTHSEQINDIFDALVKFQEEAPTIVFDEKATVPTKSGGKYEYDYASLAHVIETIQPIMAKHGLGALQPMTGKFGLSTIILHKSGQWLKFDSEIEPRENYDDKGRLLKPTAQEIGSLTSYQRRYALVSALRLAIADDDDDGDAASNDKTPKTTPAAPPAKGKEKPKPEAPAPTTKPTLTKVGMKKLIDRINVAAEPKRKELKEEALKAFELTKEQIDEIDKAIESF